MEHDIMTLNFNVNGVTISVNAKIIIKKSKAKFDKLKANLS